MSDNRKVSVKEMEQKQLAQIENFGLVLNIEREKIEPVRKVNLGPTYPYAKGNSVSYITRAGLVDKEIWDKASKREDVTYPFSGVALCSAGDQFDKRIGRVKATARALREYNKHLKEIVKREKAQATKTN